MTSRCHWMPFYPCDYMADTQHLSTLEHGAYLLLIMHYWQRGKLPEDELQLQRICRVSRYQWRQIKDTLADLFQDGWKHKRIDAELAKAERIRAKRSAAGKAAAKKKATFSENFSPKFQTNPLKNNDAASTHDDTSTSTHLDKSKWRGQARARGDRHAPPAQGWPAADVVREFKPRNDAPPDVPAISEEERFRRKAKVKAAVASFGSYEHG